MWLISATLLILTREGIFHEKKPIIKTQDISARTMFLIIGGLAVASSIMMYKFPVKPSFDTYSNTVEIISLIAGILVFVLRTKDYNALAELIWIWLLSFVNILVIDGFVKFSQTSKIISEDYDVIANSVLNFPVFINALLAFYTTYCG